MEEIGGLLSSPSCILEEEEDKLCMDDSLIIEGKKAFECCLVGKLFMKKTHNKRSILSIMENLWKSGLSFQVQEVEWDLFFFFFWDN